MILATIIQEAFQTGRVSATLEKKIDELMWSTELDREDCQAVQDLVDSLEKGIIIIE